MKNQMEYSTKDFYLASCILAAGVPLSHLAHIDRRTYAFVFSASEKEIEQLISRHWSRELLLPSRNLIEAINELKTRLYERR